MVIKSRFMSLLLLMIGSQAWHIETLQLNSGYMCLSRTTEWLLPLEPLYQTNPSIICQHLPCKLYWNWPSFSRKKTRSNVPLYTAKEKICISLATQNIMMHDTFFNEGALPDDNMNVHIYMVPIPKLSRYIYIDSPLKPNRERIISFHHIPSDQTVPDSDCLASCSWFGCGTTAKS